MIEKCLIIIGEASRNVREDFIVNADLRLK